MLRGAQLLPLQQGQALFHQGVPVSEYCLCDHALLEVFAQEVMHHLYLLLRGKLRVQSQARVASLFAVGAGC